jgi:hypothetical protein
MKVQQNLKNQTHPHLQRKPLVGKGVFGIGLAHKSVQVGGEGKIVERRVCHASGQHGATLVKVADCAAGEAHVIEDKTADRGGEHAVVFGIAVGFVEGEDILEGLRCIQVN